MKLAIFDCDGTLVDSQHLIVAAMNSAFDSVGRKTLPRAQVLSIVGLSLPLAVETLLPQAGEREVAEISQAYRDAFFKLRADPSAEEPLYDGIADLIDWLHAHDEVLLAIATGKSRRGVDRIIEMHGLENRFVAISTADEHPSKPHPSMILHALNRAGAEPEDAVMIGDTTFDIAMARAAGVASVGVDWGYHDASDLDRAGPSALVKTAAELRAELARLLTLPHRGSGQEGREQ